MEQTYPFTAIVGQEQMKLALILNLINPTLGGVLIREDMSRGIFNNLLFCSMRVYMNEMDFVNIAD